MRPDMESSLMSRSNFGRYPAIPEFDIAVTVNDGWCALSAAMDGSGRGRLRQDAW